MKAIILLFITILTLQTITIQTLKWSLENSQLYNFDHFLNQFEKKYDTEEETLLRKSIFEENLKKIHEINSNPKFTYKAGVNQFTDKTDEEFSSKFGYNKPLSFLLHKNRQLKNEKFRRIDLPASVDWRDNGKVNIVRNQGSCGSCWAFATVATVESHIAIQTEQLLSFSEQQLVDCAPNNHHCGGVGGCEGSTQSLGMNYFHLTGGMVARDDYVYQAKDGECQAESKKKIATIDGFHQIRTNDYDGLMDAIANRGPVAVSVAATDWKNYSQGIYNGNCGADINHVVVAIGYGEDFVGKYWIIRNSWANTWGEEGYIRLTREDSSSDVNCMIDASPANGSGCDGGPSQITVCGICGLYMDMSYPLGGRVA